MGGELIVVYFNSNTKYWTHLFIQRKGRAYIFVILVATYFDPFIGAWYWYSLA